MILLVAIFCLLCADFSTSFQVIKKLDHDNSCFTQGLLYHGQYLYESCGLNRESVVKKIDHTTGKVIAERILSDDIFAEGIAYYDNHLFLLTWKNRRMYILKADDLSIIGSRRYPSHIREGWGLTHDGSHLIFSDGSSHIHFLEFPSNYSVPTDSKSQTTIEYLTKSRHIVVKTIQNNKEIQQINELEYVNGYIYANIWYQDIVIKIDPRTGYIVNSYDMTHVYPKPERSRDSDCLNGIAYNPSDNKFMVTGKKWPVAYIGVFSNVSDLVLNSSSHDL